jgi:tyrosinase
MLNHPYTVIHHILVFTKTPDLTPFWDSQTTYWNSSRITATETLQYSYPEFNNVDLSNRDAVKNAIDIYIKKQYSPGGGFFSLLQAPDGGITPQAPNVINDWSTRINVKKYELSGSFTVLIFIGEVPEDPSQWGTSASFVGSHYAFVNGVAAQCDNCRSQADLVVEGYVHLTSTLAGQPGLTSYEPGVVIPYLKDNLNWRIQAVRVFHCVLDPYHP